MKNIGEKVKDLRIAKGYSQEELAIQSGLSIRTIQRIEKGTSIPRGHTLQVLGEVFELQVDDLFQKTEIARSSTTTRIQTLYFLVLLGIIVPIGNILGPLIGWSLYRKENETVNTIGKNIIFTQISYSVLTSTLTIYAIFNKLGRTGYHFEFIMLFVLVLAVLNYGLILYAGLKVEQKKKIYVPFYKID